MKFSRPLLALLVSVHPDVLDAGKLVIEEMKRSNLRFLQESTEDTEETETSSSSGNTLECPCAAFSAPWGSTFNVVVGLDDDCLFSDTGGKYLISYDCGPEFIEFGVDGTMCFYFTGPLYGLTLSAAEVDACTSLLQQVVSDNGLPGCNN